MAEFDRDSYLRESLGETSLESGYSAELVAYEDAAFIQVERSQFDECCYHNAGTCPDCASGMVRLGSCFSCPTCGYQSCGG
ncbi:hypothetical protein GF420_01155 [candidate division GN15 bacterium]|nr:hypothetical protein [candidate division GN15 bacterium]